MKIPYYVVVKGRGYWQPTKTMRAAGFRLIRCGPDGPDAWRLAASWNDRWQRFRRGEIAQPRETAPGRVDEETAESAIVYPEGSLGKAFARYRRTPEWAKKAPRTREDWWRGWKRIKPVFGDLPPSVITLEDMSEWRQMIEEKVSLREAHRALKIWRAMWKVAAAMHFCERERDPSLAVVNHAARGRDQTWSDAEVCRLVKRAWRMGYLGLAAALAVMWDSQLSPGDVARLTGEQIARRAGGRAFFTERGKTGKPVGGALSKRSSAVLDAYLAATATPLPTLPIFRSRGNPAPGPKGGRPRPGVRFNTNIMTKEFRIVRAAEFGDAEKRQMLDFRRSGAVEAIAGDVGAEPLSRAMGNTLSASNALFETYVPINLTMVDQVAAARKSGRRKLRDRNE